MDGQAGSGGCGWQTPILPGKNMSDAETKRAQEEWDSEQRRILHEGHGDIITQEDIAGYAKHKQDMEGLMTNLEKIVRRRTCRPTSSSLGYRQLVVALEPGDILAMR
jgi:hypothetical protein